MASAGGNDWSDGDRMTINIAAEKNPENLIIHNIFTLRIDLFRFLLDLKSKGLLSRAGEIGIRTKPRVCLGSARVEIRKGGNKNAISNLSIKQRNGIEFLPSA